AGAGGQEALRRAVRPGPEAVAQPGEDLERATRREERLDRCARQLRVGRERAEGAVPRIEQVRAPDPGNEPASRRADATVEREPRIELRGDVLLVAAQPLGADEGAGEEEREPAIRLDLQRRMRPVAGNERELAARADPLAARGPGAVRAAPRSGEHHLVLESRVGERVRRARAEPTGELAAQARLEALPPGPAHVLEVHSSRAGRRDGEDVVDHVGAPRAELSREPGPRPG